MRTQTRAVCEAYVDCAHLLTDATLREGSALDDVATAEASLAQHGRGVDRLTRLSIFLAPASLFGYGVVRLVDGADGEHGPGWAWSIGHVLFLAAFVAFGFVFIGLRRLVSVTTTPRGLLGDLATALGLASVAAFVRVIVRKLSTRCLASASASHPWRTIAFDSVQLRPMQEDDLSAQASSSSPTRRLSIGVSVSTS